MSALGTSLAKGWVAQYVSLASGMTSVSLRHHRFIGITRWHLKLIIQSLPLLIHIAFFFFAIRLILLLMGDSKIIGTMTLGLVIVIAGLYVGSTLHPVFSPDSPFRMPISDFFHHFNQHSGQSSRENLSVAENDTRKLHALNWLLAESPKDTVIDECIQAIHTLPPDIREIGANASQ
jgi:hypothetical protein